MKGEEARSQKQEARMLTAPVRVFLLDSCFLLLASDKKP
jgi:hypothetical protein